MPDEELFRLAAEHKLRANLSAQVKRMLADPLGEFFRHFVGQWLQLATSTRSDQCLRGHLPRPAARPRGRRQRARFRELSRKPPESLTAEEKDELKAGVAFFGGVPAPASSS